MKSKSRLLSLVLVLTMMLAMIPLTGYADTAGNSVDVFLSVSPTTSYRDGTVNYTVILQNNVVVPGANPANVNLTFTMPAADGTATGTVVVLATNLLVNVGDTIIYNSTSNPQLAVSLAHINAGVSVVLGKAEYTANYVANPAYSATGSKNIPVTILEYAKLGNYVWEDLDKDGIQDVGEPGISDIKVNLWKGLDDCTLDSDSGVIKTTTTDSNGYYLFDGLKAGKYFVQFVMPGGDWVFTQQYAGINTEVDSNADPTTGISDCITLAAGESNMTIDAGMYKELEKLTVTKTAVTSYKRTHEWDIDKNVTTEYGHTIWEEEYPKIWLYEDGSGDETATWHVDVTYVGYKDSELNVSGIITIVNTGDLDAVIVGVVDTLVGTPVAVQWPVDFDAGDTLAVGETLTLTYSAIVADKVTGVNEVAVTTERDVYNAQARVSWGEPYMELLKVVDIEDVSDLFGTKDLGTLDADDYTPGQIIPFKYDKLFKWTDYIAPGPYVYDNTATILQTGQNASAKLVVNWVKEEVCWGDETAWAYGGSYAKPNWDYVNNKFWGWTNGPLGEGTYTWDIYAGAGQNILDNGEIVGELKVVYAGGTVTVTYQMDPGYYLGETHLWVGNYELPKVKRGKTNDYTNAPGQFPYGESFGIDPEDPNPTETTWTWTGTGFKGNIYVAAHSVVWMEVPCEEPNGILE